MDRRSTYRLGAALAYLTLLGWILRCIVNLLLLPGAGWTPALEEAADEFLNWAAVNPGLELDRWWINALAALAMVGTMLATDARLRARARVASLTMAATHLGVVAGLLLTAGSLIRVTAMPVIVDHYLAAGSPDSQAAAILVYEWTRAVASVLTGVLAFGLLALWTALMGLAILRGGEMSRPLGWAALPVALSQALLGLAHLNGHPALDTRPAALPLVLMSLWFGWLGWWLSRPVQPARQRWLWPSKRQQHDAEGASWSPTRGVTRPIQQLAWWQRAITRGWQLGLSVWMPWLKKPFSALINLTRPSAPWQPVTFDTLEEYAAWLGQHARWVPDPLGGAFDFFPSLGYAAWQLEQTGEFADDCDGLAYFSSANIEPFCDSPEQRYLVTVLISPWEVGWANSAHVMLFFKRLGKWQIISNQYLYEPAWDTFLEALQQNRYVAGRPVLLAVVQDVRFRTLWMGRPAPEDNRPVALQ